MKKFSVILAVALLTGLNAEAQTATQAFQPAEEQVANTEIAVAVKPLSLEEKLAAKKAAVHAKMMAKKAELGVKPETDATYSDKIADAIVVVKEAEPVVATNPANIEIAAAKEVVVENIAKQSDTASEAVNAQDAAIAENKAQVIEKAVDTKEAVVEGATEADENVVNAAEEVKSEPTEEKVEVTEVVAEATDKVEDTKAEAVEAIAEVGNDLANTAGENKEDIAEAVNEVKEDVQQTKSDLDSLEEMLGE